VAEQDDALVAALEGARDVRAGCTALFDYLRARGTSRYDEAVTQLEHALQSAMAARRSKAPAAEVTAALLHDIGHLLIDEHDQSGDFLARDLLHEQVGADQLTPFFDRTVLEPIRLHVAAKRYLCTVDERYRDALSPASQRSYALQGGAMTPDEVAAFKRSSGHAAAVRLRRWDDGAKVAGLEVPDLEEFRAAVEACLRMSGRWSDHPRRG